MPDRARIHIRIHKMYKSTQIGEIPEEWKVIEFNSVCTKLKSGGTPLTSKREYYNGKIPFVKIEDITKANKYLTKTQTSIVEQGLNSSNAWLVPSDSLLLAIYGSLGVVSINRVEVATNQAILGIILNKEKAETDFIYYLFLSLKKRLERQAKHTTQANLTAEIIKKLKIPLPPLPEQHRIAEILTTADTAIQKVDDAIAKTERLKGGLMQELLTNGIGHEEFKDSEVGRIPRGWEIAKIGKVLVDIKYGTSMRANSDNKGFPVLRIPNILDGKINENGLRYVDLSESEKQSLTLKDGDILIVRTNANPEYIGRCALFENRKGTWVYASYLIRIRVNNKRVVPSYLAKFLQSERVRRRFLSIARTSAGNYNINIQGIRSIIIYLPTLSEQQKIAEILTTVDKKLELERKRKEKLKRIKKGLMNELLTGKKRVTIAR